MQREIRVTNGAGLLILLGTGTLLLCIALFATPEFLIKLGPLRRSLTSDNEMVRNTAFLEVAFFRGLCGLAGFTALLIAVFRKRMMSSRLWRNLTKHEPELSGVKDFGALNFSLLVIVLLAVTGLLFILLAPDRWPVDVIDMIVEEDGVVEYISAILFLISSILAIVLLSRYQMPFRHRVVLVFWHFVSSSFSVRKLAGVSEYLALVRSKCLVKPTCRKRTICTTFSAICFHRCFC